MARNKDLAAGRVVQRAYSRVKGEFACGGRLEVALSISANRFAHAVQRPPSRASLCSRTSSWLRLLLRHSSCRGPADQASALASACRIAAMVVYAVQVRRLAP